MSRDEDLGRHLRGAERWEHQHPEWAAPYDEQLDEHHDHYFPFTRPAGSEAHMFIQWKGTNVCLDFYCPCGAHGHLDGDFAYHVKCPACGQVYEMGTQVIARKVDGDDHPATQVLDVDEMETL